MYCPSCGKQTPDNSAFCLHCGTWISSPSVRSVTEWEYQDFVYKEWLPGETWVSTSGSNSYTIPGARLYFWQNRQQTILAELQKWLDQGWEPVGEVGPACIKLHQYRSVAKSFGAAGLILGTILTGGLGIFLFPLMADWFAEPTEFRVQMRRPKR